MADDDDKRKDDDDDDDDKPDVPKRDLTGKALLKMMGVMLVSLLLFGGVVRGCASCQGTNPLTGEEIPEAPPPPPPPA